MEGFRYQELMTENRRDPYFRSHPIWSDRIGAVTKRAEAISAKATPQSQKTIDQLAMMKAKLVGFIGPPNRVASLRFALLQRLGARVDFDDLGSDILPPPAFIAGDANCDGLVDFADITQVLASFNASCP